jgi:serine protease inhibitor ecotin
MGAYTMIKNFAALDENNFVVAVIAGESLESVKDMFKENNWVETYANDENKTLAGVGYKYYQEVDDFKGPSYYTDWDELEACGCEKSWEHLKIDPNSWS